MELKRASERAIKRKNEQQNRGISENKIEKKWIENDRKNGHFELSFESSVYQRAHV